MVDTAHKTEEEKKEYFDTEEELETKTENLAKWIRESKHFIAFTGAGISTSAGVPDFRSGINTVLPTGPGAWEKAATGSTKKPLLRKPTTSAIPTPCHMALVALQKAGLLKFLISQNVDGLHRKSGFPASHLAELHGNTNLEICKNESCKKQYLRDFRVRTNPEVHEHSTGRRCENCGGELYDTIVNFGEDLPEKDLKDGFEHSAKSDLCLVLGSSLKVVPAAYMPYETYHNKGKIVIVNLQATPMDEYALRINSFIDKLMMRVMEKLDIPIPSFVLRRRVAIKKTDEDDKTGKNQGKTGIFVRGIDETGAPYSLFRGARVKFTQTNEVLVREKAEPYRFYPENSNLDEGNVKIQLAFQGHYKEPHLTLDIPLESLKLNEPIYYLMEFDPKEGKWINCAPTIL